MTTAGHGTLVGFAGFTRALAESGLPVALDATDTYVRALREIDLGDAAQVYWAGRATLCREPDDLPRYDAAFRSWFGGDVPPVSRTRGHHTRTARIAALARTSGTATDDSGEDTPELQVAADDTEVLRHRDFAEMTPAEQAHLTEMLARLRPRPPLRAAVRKRPARRGEVDPRRTLRAMLGAGGEAVRPVRHRRATRPRRVVLLIDVSGSMAPYADALLRFAHVVTRSHPAGTEVFSLGTRMTRLSRALRARDAHRALDAAARTVPDWSRGTRLGDTLRTFLDRWGRRGLARGAVVVIFSDG